MTHDEIALRLLPSLIGSASATAADNFDVEGCVGLALDFAEVFLEELREREIQRAEFTGKTATKADAIAAGLCEHGVQAWIDEHLDGKEEVSLLELRMLSMRCPDDSDEIDRVIDKAVMRHEAAKAPATAESDDK